ncbi:MAG: AAA family ATPase [Candidatus Paracaedibacteraceae bacterium]|nr:AAA family ATPase [Candidatus Paracaedibacteraceae bacterium]
MHVSRLNLSHFRNHALIDVELTSEPTVFYGVNGSGKTNLLEAISFFTPGRGLRSVKLGALSQFDQSNSWAASITLDGNVRLASSLVGDKRLNKIHGESVKSTNAFSEWLSVHWLTPDQDRLFIDSSKVRRRFLDRMVYSYDPLHSDRLMDYETVVKERMALLYKTPDDRWLSLLESKMAELAVAIAFARNDLLVRLELAAQDLCPFFPKFKCTHTGDIESNLLEKKAIEWEDWLKDQWRNSRSRDREAHMTHIGVHRSDFGVIHPKKGAGDTCSTGEQKILLMGVVFAFLKNRLEWDDKLIVMLFDECVSHFDFHHRVVLFEQIRLLHDAKTNKGSFHAFMTGTDKDLFLPLNGHAAFYHVAPSLIQKG